MKRLPFVVSPLASICGADRISDELMNGRTSLRIECPDCGRVFATEDGLRRHAQDYHRQGAVSVKGTEGGTE